MIIMLKYFLNKKIKHLGIEPSSNVAKIAKKNGINTKVISLIIIVQNIF